MLRSGRQLAAARSPLPLAPGAPANPGEGIPAWAGGAAPAQARHLLPAFSCQALTPRLCRADPTTVDVTGRRHRWTAQNTDFAARPRRADHGDPEGAVSGQQGPLCGAWAPPPPQRGGLRPAAQARGNPASPHGRPSPSFEQVLGREEKQSPSYKCLIGN